MRLHRSVTGSSGVPPGPGAVRLPQSPSMTETLQRPPRTAPPSPAGDDTLRGAVLLGARSAASAAVLGLVAVLVPVLVLWAVDDRAGAGAVDAVRTAGQVWLVAHGASLEVPGGAYGLTPIGLLALPGWLLARAGRTAGPGRLLRRAATVAVPYAGLTTVVALGSATEAVRAAPLSTTATALVLAVVAVGFGGRAQLRISERWRGPGRAVLAACAVLLGAGALLAGAALALHLPRAAELSGTGAPGAVGGAGLLLAGLAFVPNAALWGAGWLAGPGFAVGAGTAVGPFGHDLGAVPALPLLAALPASAAPAWVAVPALLVPLLAGALAGRLVQRSAPGASWGRLTVQATLVGLVSGAVWTGLAWLSGGPVGGGRLSEVGPGPLAVGLAVAAAVATGAVISAVLHHLRARP